MFIRITGIVRGTHIQGSVVYHDGEVDTSDPATGKALVDAMNEIEADTVLIANQEFPKDITLSRVFEFIARRVFDPVTDSVIEGELEPPLLPVPEGCVS